MDDRTRSLNFLKNTIRSPAIGTIRVPLEASRFGISQCNGMHFSGKMRPEKQPGVHGHLPHIFLRPDVSVLVVSCLRPCQEIEKLNTTSGKNVIPACWPTRSHTHTCCMPFHAYFQSCHPYPHPHSLYRLLDWDNGQSPSTRQILILMTG